MAWYLAAYLYGVGALVAATLAYTLFNANTIKWRAISSVIAWPLVFPLIFLFVREND